MVILAFQFHLILITLILPKSVLTKQLFIHTSQKIKIEPKKTAILFDFLFMRKKNLEELTHEAFPCGLPFFTASELVS